MNHRQTRMDMEELDRLQREYRNMEANRKAYADESAVVCLRLFFNFNVSSTNYID
jgi:hypothetical protein